MVPCNSQSVRMLAYPFGGHWLHVLVCGDLFSSIFLPNFPTKTPLEEVYKINNQLCCLGQNTLLKLAMGFKNYFIIKLSDLAK